jgi:CarD family transcriptional regulator
MFSVKDVVRYGTSGVCEITEIVSRPFNGQVVDYFVLRPVHDGRSTLFVPSNNEGLVAKMVSVLSRDAVKMLISKASAIDAIWITDEIERRRVYKESLNNGDHKAIIGIIKALHEREQLVRSKGKKLRLDDERTLRDAERQLYDEFGYVLGIKPENVRELIFNH